MKLIFNHSFLRTKDKAPSAKGEERTPPHLKSLYKKSQKKNKSKSFNVIIRALEDLSLHRLDVGWRQQREKNKHLGSEIPCKRDEIKTERKKNTNLSPLFSRALEGRVSRRQKSRRGFEADRAASCSGYHEEPNPITILV